MKTAVPFISSRVVLWVWVGLGLLTARAQTSVPDTSMARSHSGQFIIRAARGSASPDLWRLETNQAYVRLETTLLPMSCERIKQVLWRQMGVSAPWRSPIYVALYPATSSQSPVRITSGKFRDGWYYRVELPDLIERASYVRALVQVLLLEIANRGATSHGAEIPAWLTEGFTQQLLLANETEIILPPPQPGQTGISVLRVKRDGPREDPLGRARQELAARAPLSFQQLSWPPEEDDSGRGSVLYRCSAQLFLNELLRLANGRNCLRTMVEELPQYYNWQFAFLHAFNQHFQRPLDVDKWWTLQTTHFTGRNLMDTWTAQESRQKLDEIIRSAVEVRLGTNDLPLHAEVPLQAMIREWDHERQVQALGNKLRELEMVRLRVVPDLVPLIDEYRLALTAYLNQPQKSGIPFRKKSVRPEAVEETLRQLDALDARRAAMAAPEKPTVARATPQ